MTSIDTATERNLSKQKSFHGLNLILKKSRKIYFMSYQQMLSCLDKLLQA